VHVNSLKAGVVGGVAARLRGIPVVWHVRDRLAPDYLPNAAVGVLRAAVNRVATAVIVNSESTGGTVALPGHDRPHVIHDPLSTDHLRPPGPRQSSAPRGPDETDVRVLCVGRFAPWKGQDVVVRAAGQMVEVDEVRFSFVGGPLFGEDEYEREVRALVERLGLQPRVRFEGERRDVADLLRESDVLVLSSVLPEPFGQAVAEGLAAGLAVVATDAGGPAELIEDGVDGLLVLPGDPAALASTLDDLVRDPALRRRLGVAGRRRAQSLRPELIGPAVEAVYESVLVGSP
jgi:glycosyltransferase involved in cell wall biosynthesis